jgi:hypothetical protein
VAWKFEVGRTVMTARRSNAAFSATVQPLFGDDAGRHRYTGPLPPSGLGTPLRQLATGAGGDFNEREMAMVRAASSRGQLAVEGRRARGRGEQEPNFEIVGAPTPARPARPHAPKRALRGPVLRMG